MDSHPDTFTAARIRGATPQSAVVEKVSNAVEILSNVVDGNLLSASI
jgi:hypothetical protein